MKKQCFKCNIIKDIKMFYKHPEMGDGYLGKCIKCAKKDVQDRYDDPEARKRIQEYEKKRFQYPERKKKILEYQRKRDQSFPGKNRARHQLNDAIKNGKIKREKCEVCGDEKSQAHHSDYRQPLNVKWLCFKHHRGIHGQKTG